VRRGEVRYIDFEPVRGSEANKRRPAVIVSNDGANTMAELLGAGVITVVPLTSNTATVHPFQVLVAASSNGVPVTSKAQAEQVRAVAVSRIGARIGQVDTTTMSAIDDALRLHLAL
jgi:mRNA interferase MazF